MDIGMIGLGRMGANMAERLVRGGHRVVGFDRNPSARKSAETQFDLDLHQIAEIWRDGSVVRSWLLDLTSAALAKSPSLEGIAPYVADSGEGRWTLAEAIDLDVATPVIALSLLERLRSRDAQSFSDKLLSAMRHQFGGHEIKKE